MSPTAPKPLQSRNTSPTRSEFDALVLGGGMAGLAAAGEMARAGMRVCVLESRNRLGGRIHTINLAGAEDPPNAPYEPDDARVPADLGASFVHGADNNPLTAYLGAVPGFALARPTEPTILQTVRSNSHGRLAVPQDEAAKELEYSFEVTFARLSQLSQSDPEWEPTDDMSLLSAMQGRVSPSDPDPEKTKIKLEQLWEGVPALTRERILAQPEMWAGWTGAPIDQIALRWWGSDEETVGDDAVVPQGFGRLIKYLSVQLFAHAGQIKLQHRVTAVNEGEEGGRHSVEASTPDGPKTFFADYIVCTLPLGVLKHASPKFNPPLPKRKQSAIARLGFGLLNKIILHYPTAWWAGKGESHLDRWIEVVDDANSSIPGSVTKKQSASAIDQVVSGYFHLQDYSSIHGHPVLMAFVPPPLAEVLETIPREEEPELFARLHERLETALLPADKHAPAPANGVVTRWRSDPHALGSYTYIPPRSEKQASASSWDLVELAQPLWSRTLRFAGEGTHRNWFASVHGAWATGMAEGKQLATMHDLRLNPKSSAVPMIP